MSAPRKRQNKAAANGSLQPRQDAANDKTSSPDVTTGAVTTEDADSGYAATARGMAFTAVPAWLNMGVMVVLIFGGCCANVRDVLPSPRRKDVWGGVLFADRD